MKKSFVIITLILLCFEVIVMAGGESISYVKTGNKVYFGQDIKFGIFNIKIISTDGTIVKVPNRDVKAYLHDSRLFELMPVINENNDNQGFAMMEFITSRSGLKLYRYSGFECKETKYEYFVFKNDRLYLRIDQKNALSTLPFFGIEVK